VSRGRNKAETAQEPTQEDAVMSKFVVVVFPNEAKASEGLHAFKELDAEDSLTVYAGAVIVKMPRAPCP
jgi:uncharacterized membrane protein